MTAFYNFLYNIFSYPFGYALSFLYQINGKNYLMAVIIFAVIIKLILLPTSISSQKNAAKSQRMQARMNKIREKYANDQNAQNEAIQELYKKEGFSSMSSGCGALLIQFPIIMGLYGAIYKPLTYILRVDHLFGKGTIDSLISVVNKIAPASGSTGSRIQEISVITNIDSVKEAMPNMSSGLYNLIADFGKHFTAFGYNFGDIPKDIHTTVPSVMIIPIIAFVAAMISSIYSIIHAKKMPGSTKQSMMSMGCMMLFMPLMSLWLAYQFPVGIGIYWAVNSLLGFFQMIALDKLYPPDKVIAMDMVDESIVRRQKEVNVKAKVQAAAETESK